MRYLTVRFALGALRRGRGIQQLLGTACVARATDAAVADRLA
jgi:hypothetical protein